jgi:AraC-like DNA-binding protein
LVTEQIDRGNKPDQKCVWNAHYRVKASVVETALQAALQAAIPPSLPEIANQVGYRSVASLKFRYRALCREIVGRRRAQMRVSNKAPVPRERIEKALLEALSKPGFTDVRVVMASVGLRSTSRLYKYFRDLRLAIAAKNATIKRRRLETARAALITAIKAAGTTPCNQPPVPTVTELAQRMGFATAEPLTSRFPELTTELRACRRRATQGKYRHRASERVRQRLTEALREFPPPSCAAVVRSLAGHWTQIREDFPDLWRSLRQRYGEYAREVHRAKREAFTGEVYRAVAELHGQGICPNVPLVLAAIPHPQFHSRNMVAKAVRLARHELSIKPYEAFRDQRCPGGAENSRTNSTFAEAPDGAA